MAETMARSEPRLGEAKTARGTIRGDRAAAMPAQVGMAVVYALIGYEWLLSGVNKLLLGPDFARGLPQLLQSGLAGNPDGWFGRLAGQVVAPHAAIMAASVDELLEVNDVGPVVAEAIHNFFSEAHNQHVIEQLRASRPDAAASDSRSSS